MNNQFYLGIDIGKHQHQATLINHQGLMVGESLRFNNQLSDFKILWQTIQNQLPSQAIVKAGLEATGHYYWHLKDYLISKGIPVEVINPIETQLKARTKIRKVKNDKTDSLLIAEITSRRKHSQPTFEHNQKIKQLRELTRFSEKLKSQARFYKQEISTLLERICPEFNSCFNNLFLKTPLMIIQEYFLSRTSKQDLIQNIIKTSRNRIKTSQAQEIIAALNHSLGCNYRNLNTKLQLKMLLQSLNLVSKQIEKVQQHIQKASQRFNEIQYISSIKGISQYMASVILSEINSIERFANKNQLTAFAGLDASVKQSGAYQRQQGNHISKRGSKYLRKQLYYAAKTAAIFDPELKQYYLKKKAQGKHYNVIMIAIARKLLMRIYALLKQKRLYELRTAHS